MHYLGSSVKSIHQESEQHVKLPDDSTWIVIEQELNLVCLTEQYMTPHVVAKF
jgi:hypothetical protein